MAKKAPGKAHRDGDIGLMDMFPTEKAATEWFESVIWPENRPKCGSLRTREVRTSICPIGVPIAGPTSR